MDLIIHWIQEVVQVPVQKQCMLVVSHAQSLLQSGEGCSLCRCGVDGLLHLQVPSSSSQISAVGFHQSIPSQHIAAEEFAIILIHNS